jgi:hypothetical protein
MVLHQREPFETIFKAGWVIHVLMCPSLEVVQEHDFAVAKRTVWESVTSSGSLDGRVQQPLRIRLPAKNMSSEAFTQKHCIFPALDSNLDTRSLSHLYPVLTRRAESAQAMTCGFVMREGVLYTAQRPR